MFVVKCDTAGHFEACGGAADLNFCMSFLSTCLWIITSSWSGHSSSKYLKHANLERILVEKWSHRNKLVVLDSDPVIVVFLPIPKMTDYILIVLRVSPPLVSSLYLHVLVKRRSCFGRLALLYLAIFHVKSVTLKETEKILFTTAVNDRTFVLCLFWNFSPYFLAPCFYIFIFLEDGW